MRLYSLTGLFILILGSLLHRPSFEVLPLFHGHVMRTSSGETYLAPDSPNGLGMNGESVVLEADTWTVTNCLTHGLGLELLILNMPDGVEELRLLVDFPPMTLPSGKVNHQMDRMQPLFVEDNVGYFDFYYFFDEEYERGLGEWRFRLYHGERLIYDEAFTVVACESDAG